MLPEPIEFQIVKNLQALVSAIKTPDYHYTVKGLAVKLDPDHKVEDLVPGANDPIGPPRPWAVIDVSASPTFEYLERTARVAINMPFVVHLIHDTDTDDDDDKLRTYLRLFADVEKTIAPNQQHGGLAFSTLITGRTMRDVEGQQVWAQIAGVVRLHRGFGAPNG